MTPELDRRVRRAVLLGHLDRAHKELYNINGCVIEWRKTERGSEKPLLTVADYRFISNELDSAIAALNSVLERLEK